MKNYMANGSSDMNCIDPSSWMIITLASVNGMHSVGATTIATILFMPDENDESTLSDLI